MKLVSPHKLKNGDTLAIIAPSSGLAGLFPHRLDKGIAFLKSWGFKIKEFYTTRRMTDWHSGTAEERARDIMNAFMDEEVKGIFCTIGGYTSNQVLPYLDFGKIRENPKFFCGYSDISILHYAFYKKAKLQTFYGPSVMVQFAEFPKPLDYTLTYFKKAAMDEEPIGEIEPSESWTDEVLNWGAKEDQERAREMRTNKGYTWLRKGRAIGPILGGCLSSIVHLRGTEYWPSHKGTILLLEIPEGHDFSQGEPLEAVDSYLTDLKLSNVFDEIVGLVFGRPFRYIEEDTEKLKAVILENTKEYDFPILFGVDVGHTDPQITVPLGALVEITSENNLFKIQ
ncbi:MAG: S66 family peptidase [Candidatus Hodarchaeales archaeon]|jgi:muramoyltetrapeptide carboxypeptidase